MARPPFAFLIKEKCAIPWYQNARERLRHLIPKLIPLILLNTQAGKRAEMRKTDDFRCLYVGYCIKCLFITK